MCAKCGEELADGAAMTKRELEAAVLLTSYKPSADAIRFFRSVLSLKAKDFADLVGWCSTFRRVPPPHSIASARTPNPAI